MGNGQLCQFDDALNSNLVSQFAYHLLCGVLKELAHAFFPMPTDAFGGRDKVEFVYSILPRSGNCLLISCFLVL